MASGVAIVTGATGTFGQHIAAGLIRAGYETVCTGRDQARGDALVNKLRAEFPSANISFAVVDCSSFKSIQRFAKTWSTRETPLLDVLVNNAAITPQSREVSPEGIELQWACNVLGYHWMIEALLPFLRLAPQPRIVNVASHYASGLNLSNPEFTGSRRYSPDAAYKQSKQANRMLARLWADQLGTPFIVTSCHPGVAASAVADGLGFDFDSSVAAAVKGSVTPLFCALHGGRVGQPANGPPLVSGAFYSDCKRQQCPFSSDLIGCEELWNVLQKYTAAVSSA